MTNLISKISALTSMVLLTACGGGSDTPDLGVKAPPSLASNAMGVFLDAPVHGLRVERSGGAAGVTGPYGEFKYATGDTLTFYLGALKLGSALAKAELTPLDLFSTSDVNDRKVLNLLRLLQSLDANDKPADGIQLNSQMLQAAADSLAKISIDQETTSFQSSADVVAVLNKKRAGMTLISVTEAKSHFNATRQTASQVGMFSGNLTLNGRALVTNGLGGVMGVYNGSYTGADNKKYSVLLQSQGTGTAKLQVFSTIQQATPIGVINLPDVKEEIGTLTTSASEIRFSGNNGGSLTVSKSGAAALIGTKAFYAGVSKGSASICANGAMVVSLPTGYGVSAGQYVGMAYFSATGMQYAIKPLISIGADQTTTGVLSMGNGAIEFALPLGKLSIPTVAAGNDLLPNICA